MNPDIDISPLVFDLETAPLVDARAYVDPPELNDVQAPANYKDPEKIAAYIAEAKAKALNLFEQEVTEKAALDWNLARIVALGWWASGKTTVHVISNQFEEREALRAFWTVAKHRSLVGFRCREFDVPMLLQRSLYLDVPCRRFDLGRYSKGSPIIDLYDWFTFNDMRYAKVMPCSLRSVCRRFGIPVSDTVKGEDIPKLVQAEDWAAVEAHCASDVALTVQLAQRCGVVRKPEPTTGELVRSLQERLAANQAEPVL